MIGIHIASWYDQLCTHVLLRLLLFAQAQLSTWYGQMSVVEEVCARSTLCDPYLNLFRGIIPPLNGTIDLSPILAFIALDVSSTSALLLPKLCLYAAASSVESHGFSSICHMGCDCQSA